VGVISRGSYFRALLKIKGIYEVTESLYPVGKEPVLLGIVREIYEDSVAMDVLASKHKKYYDGLCRPYRLFRSIKVVSFQDLPLYVGWAWKSDEFAWMLKEGKYEVT
jgi:hypothetical protein